MYLTRNGWGIDSFYSTNDMNVIHWRFLFNALKQVPELSFNDVKPELIHGLKFEKVNSEYTAAAYRQNVSYETSDDAKKTIELTPFIDDQLQTYHDHEVKPQLDDFKKKFTDYEQELSTLSNNLLELQAKLEQLTNKGDK